MFPRVVHSLHKSAAAARGRARSMGEGKRQSSQPWTRGSRQFPNGDRVRCITSQSFRAKGRYEFAATIRQGTSKALYATLAALHFLTILYFALTLVAFAVNSNWVALIAAIAIGVLYLVLAFRYLRKNGRTDLLLWHFFMLAPLRETYSMLRLGFVDASLARFDLRLDAPFVGRRMLILTYLLHALCLCSPMLLLILFAGLSMPPSGFDSAGLLATACAVLGGNIAAVLSASDRHSLLTRRVVVPDNRDSALVRSCPPCKHYSAAFMSFAVHRLLEVPSRALMFIIWGVAFGWAGAIPLLVISFVIMLYEAASRVPFVVALQ